MRNPQLISARSCSCIVRMSNTALPQGGNPMSLTLRPGRPEDATMCGTICYEAFKTIAEQHNFPTNYPSPEAAIERMVERLTHPGLYAVVAELDGCVVGSNFLDERSAIAGLGPITVAPTVQNRTIGRHLMQDVLDPLPHGTIQVCASCWRPIMRAH